MDNFVFFWKPKEKNGHFSNWSEHSIIENDIYFRTLEHYIMYYKAMLMNDHVIANKIATDSTITVNQVKQLGKEISYFDPDLWDQNKRHIIKKGLLLKVDQHPELIDLLLETNNKMIAEASPYDKIWGIGISKTDPRALDPYKWPGKNILGEAWMEVRNFIK